MFYFSAQIFPAAFRGNTFIGNVMTCRINRDSFVEHGSTRVAKEEPDFLRCDDPWFRPVDSQLGPDGAVYVADFYNRIIGHYEVSLDHPGRDRERGRIWRIVYRGNRQSNEAPNRSHDRQIVDHPRDLSSADASQLVSAFNDANLTVRRLATDQLSDRLGASAFQPLNAVLRS